jgi:hypothetical protein
MAVQSESAEQQQNLQQQPTSSSEALKEEKPFHTVDEYRKALETFTPPKVSYNDDCYNQIRGSFEGK